MQRVLNAFRAFASMRALRFTLRARAMIKFVLRAASTSAIPFYPNVRLLIVIFSCLYRSPVKRCILVPYLRNFEQSRKF